MLVIETERLKLVPLNFEQLTLLRQERALLETSMGLKISAMEIDDFFMAEIDDAMNFWLEGTSTHPDHYQWYTNWDIILKKENMVVGGIGLTGLPDENGEVMTGYLIDKKYHRQGFAAEALSALAEWVFLHPEVRAIKADTPSNNLASQGVLSKNYFVKIGKSEGCLHWKRYR